MSSELELLKQRVAELEAENTKRQDVKENAELKNRIEELEKKKNNDTTAENSELKTRLPKLERDFP